MAIGWYQHEAIDDGRDDEGPGIGSGGGRGQSVVHGATRSSLSFLPDAAREVVLGIEIDQFRQDPLDDVMLFEALQCDVLRGWDGLPSDGASDGTPYNGALFVHAAWQCASTFRITDYAGGCNGAKIRFAPQKDWPVNAGVDKIIAALEPIKTKYATLSTADLIVLAGQAALEEEINVKIDFLGGRTDGVSGEGDESLAPRENYPSVVAKVLDNIRILGVSQAEAVALAGRPRSVEQQKVLGYSGSYSRNSATLSNEYFQILLAKKWSRTSADEFRAEGKGENYYMMATDVALLEAPELKKLVEQFAKDEVLFKRVFASAWAKAMTADHFNASSY